MGSFLSRLWWGPEPAKPGGVDRKGSLPADYDEWKPRYYEPEVRKPDPPVVRPAPEPEIIPKPTPEVTELQRVHETKVEHEKITNDSGSTTEKTQYTQITESMRIQEGKGPIAEPFDSSKQHTVFPTFTELKTSVDTSPTADVKRHEIHILSPKEPEVEDVSESEKTEEEKEDAIVKIQAGVRGYLTRKALKERSVTPEPPPRPVSEDIVEKESSKAVQATPPTELKKGSSTVSPLAQPTTQASDEEQEEEESAEAEEAATKIQAAFRGYKVRKQGRPDPPARKNNQQIVVDLDEDEEEEEEEEEDESDEGTVSESDE